VIGENPDKYVWVKFYHVKCSKGFETNWYHYLKESNLPDNPIPWQHLTVKYFESILQTKLQPSGPMHSNEAAITECTYEEENAI